MTRRAVRCVCCEFEEAVTRIVAFPTPVVALRVTHAASVRAVHSQSRVELTVTLAVPPVCEIVRAVVDADTTQRTADGATTSVWLVTPPHPAINSDPTTASVWHVPVVSVCRAVTRTGDVM